MNLHTLLLGMISLPHLEIYLLKLLGNSVNLHLVCLFSMGTNHLDFITNVVTMKSNVKSENLEYQQHFLIDQLLSHFCQKRQKPSHQSDPSCLHHFRHIWAQKRVLIRHLRFFKLVRRFHCLI